MDPYFLGHPEFVRPVPKPFGPRRPSRRRRGRQFGRSWVRSLVRRPQPVGHPSPTAGRPGPLTLPATGSHLSV